MSPRQLFLISIVFFIALRAFAQNGVIQGTVIDEKGNVVPDAQVNWYDIDPPKDVVEVHTGPQAAVATDKDGRFLIKNLMAGHRYDLVAQKPEAGYPDMSSSLYNAKPQIAAAQPEGQALDVTVRMGPKAMRLDWDVKDATTGKPMQGISFAIRRMDGAGESADQAPVGGSAPGKYSWLVPSDIAVTIEFSAPGYQTWYYPGTANKAARTFMATAPGQATKLAVFLQPVAQQSGQTK